MTDLLTNIPTYIKMTDLLDNIHYNGPQEGQEYNQGLIESLQKRIYEDKDIIVALDTISGMYYVQYNEIMMIDIDFKKSVVSVVSDDPDIKQAMDKIQKITKDANMKKAMDNVQRMHEKTGDTYMVFESANGIHVFIANRKFDYKSKEVLDYMCQFGGCDSKYISFSRKQGWRVRVNRKTEDDPMYSYIKTVGDDPKFQDLVDKHDFYAKKYQNTMINQYYVYPIFSNKA